MSRYGLELVRAPEFIGGGSDSVELRRRHVLRALLLRLTYDWSMTGGTGAGSIPGDAHFRLLRRASIEANGQTVQSYPGIFLGLLHRIWSEELLAQTPPTNIGAGAAEADREALFLLPFYMPFSDTPDEFAFPSRNLRDPLLRVTWGNAADLVIGEDGVPGIANAAVELYEQPHIAIAAGGVQGRPVAPPGDWSGLLVRSIEREVVQAGTLDIVLDHLLSSRTAPDAWGHELRAVFIQAQDDGVAGSDFVDADDVVTHARLVVGSTAVRERVAWRVIQQMNKQAYGLAALEVGAAVLDSAEDRRTGRGDLWTVLGRETPVLSLDVTPGGGQSRVIVTTVYAARTPPASVARG